MKKNEVKFYFFTFFKKKVFNSTVTRTLTYAETLLSNYIPLI